METNAYGIIIKWWRDKNIRTEAELAEILNGNSVLFAFHSGKLENERVTWHDTREIFERDGVSNYTGDLRTLFEIRNAKSAYEFFLSSFGEKRPLDESFLLRLQKLLTRNTYDTRRYQLGERPGAYKLHDFVTGKYEIGASPEDTADEIKELLSELKNIPSDFPAEKILTAAAYFHAKFENIHPFADGNGRTGRLATNYFLVTRNHPPIVIYEEDRVDYYAALESWDTTQDLEPMREFFKNQLIKTWSKRINKSENLDIIPPSRLKDFL